MFDGIDILSLTRSELRHRRKDIQIIFQDPFASLDPRMTVGRIVAEGLEIHRPGVGKAKGARVAELLESVGLSGSDAQRIGIARALAVDPKLLVAYTTDHG